MIRPNWVPIVLGPSRLGPAERTDVALEVQMTFDLLTRHSNIGLNTFGRPSSWVLALVRSECEGRGADGSEGTREALQGDGVGGGMEFEFPDIPVSLVSWPMSHG